MQLLIQQYNNYRKYYTQVYTNGTNNIDQNRAFVTSSYIKTAPNTGPCKERWCEGVGRKNTQSHL